MSEVREQFSFHYFALMKIISGKNRESFFWTEVFSAFVCIYWEGENSQLFLREKLSKYLFTLFEKWKLLKQARKLQATLVRNYESPTDWLTDGGWSVELLA